MVDGNKRYINTKSNIYEINNSTESDIANSVKTKPHFRKIFTHTFKSTKVTYKRLDLIKMEREVLKLII